jgi:hypothetical protein
MRRDDVTWYNTVEGRETEFPSGNFQSNAQSLNLIATVFANGGKVNGTLLLSDATVREALSDGKVAYDGFLKSSYSFTKGGFCNFDDMDSPLVHPEFKRLYKGFTGWCGLGGGLNMWNVRAKVGLSYCVTGKTLQPLSGPRGDKILKAVQEVLKRL